MQVSPADIITFACVSDPPSASLYLRSESLWLQSAADLRAKETRMPTGIVTQQAGETR
jgi:hypothetical protein